MGKRERDLIRAESFDELTRQASSQMQADADLVAMELGLTIIRAGNRLQQDLETNVHRPAGMTWAAFRVLFVIRSVGPTSPRQVARLSSISTASASSVLNTLERYGMITRSRDASDGRAVTVSLTDEGERAVRELFVRNNNRNRQWVAVFTEKERQTLTALLHRLLDMHAPRREPGAAALEPIRRATR